MFERWCSSDISLQHSIDILSSIREHSIDILLKHSIDILFSIREHSINISLQHSIDILSSIGEHSIDILSSNIRASVYSSMNFDQYMRE